MNKLQERGKITSVEDANLELYPDRVRINFVFETASNDDDDDAVDNFLASIVRNNEYHVLARNPKGDNTKKNVEELAEKLVNKTSLFTVYDIPVFDLLEGTDYDGCSEVFNSDDEDDKDFRGYTSFKRAFVGKYDDADGVIKAERRKLLSRIAEEDYFVPKEYRK